LPQRSDEHQRRFAGFDRSKKTQRHSGESHIFSRSSRAVSPRKVALIGVLLGGAGLFFAAQAEAQLLSTCWLQLATHVIWKML
jgi:hypothetical protein